MSITALLAEILFIGHSLIGPSLPGLVESAARNRRIEVVSHYQIINGAPLDWNWKHAHEAEGVDGRALLSAGGIDHVIMTEAIPLAAHLRWSDSAGAAKRFYDLAIEGNPDAQVWLYETWHGLDSGTERANPDDPDSGVPWRQRLVDDLPKWQGIADAVNAGRPEGARRMRLIPAGQAMGLLADEIDAGRVPGLDSIGQLYSDDVHLNDRGRYLVTMVMFAAVSGQNPAGISHRIQRRWESRDTVVTEDMARAMQAAAWRAVEDQRRREATAPDRAAAPPASPLVREAAVPPAAPAVPVVQAAADDPGPPEIANPALAIGLSSVVDWTPAQPFVNVMKAARAWVGHRPGRWGGMEHEDLAAGGFLDPDGWPTGIPPGIEGIATVLLTDLPETAASTAGRYRVTHAGRGTLELSGRAQNVTRTDEAIFFDFTPGPGPVILTIRATDPADPIRDIAIVHERNLAHFAAGAVFDPLWRDRLRGVRLLRFMDWMRTNDSTATGLADMPRPDDYTWTRRGVPPEVMVQLANDLGADAWFNMPHLADDALVLRYAEIVRDGLRPGLRAWVEYSNEVWNWQFRQAHWAEAEGRRRWGRDSTWMQVYGLRAAEVADIWAATFGAAAPERLVRVVSVQTGWMGLEHDALEAPLWVAADPANNRPPHESFDAYAITGYFSGMLGGDEKAPLVLGWIDEGTGAAAAEAARRGLSGVPHEAFIRAHRYDAAVARAAAEMRDGSVTGNRDDSIARLIDTVFPYHAAVAERYGLRLVMYEGGTHLVGLGRWVDEPALTDFFIHMNFTPEMGALYRDLIAGWHRFTPEPFMNFGDVFAPSKWGSWGALRHLADDNPRWQALIAAP